MRASIRYASFVLNDNLDRYFGGSSPYDGFDSDTLQSLTMDQAAADIVNFAQNVEFPFDKNKTSVSTKTVRNTTTISDALVTKH